MVFVRVRICFVNLNLEGDMRKKVRFRVVWKNVRLSCWSDEVRFKVVWKNVRLSCWSDELYCICMFLKKCFYLSVPL